MLPVPYGHQKQHFPSMCYPVQYPECTDAVAEDIPTSVFSHTSAGPPKEYHYARGLEGN